MNIKLMLSKDIIGDTTQKYDQIKNNITIYYCEIIIPIIKHKSIITRSKKNITSVQKEALSLIYLSSLFIKYFHQ